MDKFEVLKKSDLFHHLDENELKAVEKICSVEVFNPGDIIFRQDGEADKVYVIEEGCVSLCLELGPTDKRQIQAASNFECFGWAALIPPFRRLNMAKAVEKTSVLVFSGKELRNLINTGAISALSLGDGLSYVISLRLKAAFHQLMGYDCQD